MVFTADHHLLFDLPSGPELIDGQNDHSEIPSHPFQAVLFEAIVEDRFFGDPTIRTLHLLFDMQHPTFNFALTLHSGEERHLLMFERDHSRGIEAIEGYRRVCFFFGHEHLIRPEKSQCRNVIEHFLQVRLNLLRIRCPDDREKFIIGNEVEASEHLSFAVEIVIETLLNSFDQSQDRLQFVVATGMQAGVLHQWVAGCF